MRPKSFDRSSKGMGTNLPLACVEIGVPNCEILIKSGENEAQRSRS